jgi:hypothetical protein
MMQSNEEKIVAVTANIRALSNPASSAFCRLLASVGVHRPGTMCLAHRLTIGKVGPLHKLWEELQLQRSLVKQSNEFRGSVFFLRRQGEPGEFQLSG